MTESGEMRVGGDTGSAPEIRREIKKFEAGTERFPPIPEEPDEEPSGGESPTETPIRGRLARGAGNTGQLSRRTRQ